MKKRQQNSMYNHYFKDKRVWISGASSGIGLSLVTRLIESGARVIMSSRNDASLKQIAQNLKMMHLIIILWMSLINLLTVDCWHILTKN